MPKIICVYQDCPLCGDRGKVVQKIVEREGVQLEKVSFASERGRELIHTAIFEHKIGTMPFYTDGKRFSTDIEELLAKPAKKTTKKAKKVKGADDGVVE